MKEQQVQETEADFHFALYGAFSNIIKRGDSIGDTTYSKIIPRPKLENLKEPDLVLEDSASRPILVIEAKRKDNSPVKTDPFSPKVIEQAMGYAIQLGTPYFATCNKDLFVLFETFKKFVPLSQRRLKIYYMKDYGDLETFVGQLLNDLTDLSKPKSVFQWTPDHEFLIARLKYLHNILIHPFENALSKILDENQDFLKRYKDFLELEGFSFDEERNKITARESAYLVTFYDFINSEGNL